ncbi:hypothetical protein [Gordonia iterans]
MSERDVLDVLRDMCNTIDYAIASRVSPAYPDASIRQVIGRAADELAESRAEVERLRCVLRGSDRASLRLVEASDELRAEVEKVRKLRDVEVRQLCQQWETAADWAAWFAAERDEALAAIERGVEQ